jgi:hypothetical protein
MFLFDVDADAAPGAELFDARDPGQPAGMVANGAPNPAGGFSLLAEVKLASVGDSALQLHLGRADGPALSMRELPYAVPREAVEVS